MDAGCKFAGRPADSAVPAAVNAHVAPESEGSVLVTVPLVQIPTGLVHTSFTMCSVIVASKLRQAGCASAPLVTVPMAIVERRIILMMLSRCHAMSSLVASQTTYHG
jgi:hypothetical protein